MSEAVQFAEMISKMAHELRSPLTSVKGFSATLIKRWDRFTDEQRFQFVETIHADANRMGRIVSEVLDLARLEAGRLELHATGIEIAPVLEAAVQNHGSLPGAERVTIECEDGLRAWADSDRLGHIVSNIVENAIKFSDEGPIVVTAGRSGDSVEIRVTDKGVGIEPDRIGGVFSGPAPAGQHATPSGTGLGLYLSRRLVEVHAGSIDVSSEPGVGSTFTVRIPASSPTEDG
jgi:signal transduction histidine kinase